MLSMQGNNIKITKGDTGLIMFVLKQKCKDFNLNGWGVRFIVKQKGEPDSAALLDASAVIEEDTDRVNVAISASNTDRAGSYDWALRLSKSGAVYTLAEGIFTIEQGVFA